jgi:GDP-D-mannose dehydratase
MFGQPLETPQTERTPFAPTTPYATSKVFAHWIAINHRTHYGIFVTNGILFNHESSRRGMHSHLSATRAHMQSQFLIHVKMTANINILSKGTAFAHGSSRAKSPSSLLERNRAFLSGT